MKSYAFQKCKNQLGLKKVCWNRKHMSYKMLEIQMGLITFREGLEANLFQIEYNPNSPQKVWKDLKGKRLCNPNGPHKVS